MHRSLLVALFANGMLSSCSSPSETTAAARNIYSEVQIPVGYGKIILSNAVIDRVWTWEPTIIEWTNLQTHQVTVWCLQSGQATLWVEFDNAATESVSIECHDQGIGG